MDCKLQTEIISKLRLASLNDRQKKFCFYYAADGDAAEAVRKAGYKFTYPYQAKNTAWRLIQIPDIKHNIEILDAELASDLIADAAECKMHLTEIARDEMCDVKDRLSAIRMLLQSHGELSHGNAVQVEDNRIQISILGVSHTFDEKGNQVSLDGDVLDVLPEPETTLGDLI